LLKEFLKVMQEKNESSLLQIASRLGISVEMAQQMAEELSCRGYLEEIGVDCAEPLKVCAGCAAKRSCNEARRRWVMTEKGKAAIG